MRVTGVATCRLCHRRHVLAGVGVCVRVSGKMCAIWSRPSAHLLEKMSVSGTGLRRRLDLVEGSAEECHCEVVQNSCRSRRGGGQGCPPYLPRSSYGGHGSFAPQVHTHTCTHIHTHTHTQSSAASQALTQKKNNIQITKQKLAGVGGEPALTQTSGFLRLSKVMVA